MKPASRGLLITHCFSPSALPESYVLAKAIGNVPGIRFDVACTDVSRRFKKDPSIDSYVQHRFGRILRVQPHPLTERLPHRFNPLAQLPDLFVFTNSALLQASRALDPEGQDVFLTSSMYHSAHCVGLKLKSAFPKTRWVARFSDPWIGNPYLEIHPLCRRRNEALERKVFSRADCLVFTSPLTAERVAERVPAWIGRKIQVIPHCYDPELYPNRKAASAASGYTIRHLGHFYGHRSPEPLLRSIERLASEEPALLEGLRIELIGSLGRHQDLPQKFPAASRVITVRTPVPYAESLRLAQEAQCLLVIDAPADASEFLPSKLIDYLGAERFILALSPAGATSDVVKRAGGLTADPSDSEAIHRAVRELLVRRPESLPRMLDEFSVSAVARSWKTVLSG